MPKLILFAPAEKVVVDETDKTTSLISLLEGITVTVPETEKDKLPPDATIAVNWHLLALWQVEEGDESKEFETRFVLRFTKENEHVIPGLPFRFANDRPNFRNVVRIMGLPLVPILGINVFTVHVLIREKGSDTWNERGSFPILIRDRPVPFKV